MSSPLVRGFRAATLNAIGLKKKVPVGSAKRNRINILLTLMQTCDIEVLLVQEPHFLSEEDISSPQRKGLPPCWWLNHHG